jgi:hypothetical protein
VKFAALGLVGLSGAALAATTGSVALRGTVAPILALTTTPDAGNLTLDLAGTSATASAVAKTVRVATLDLVTNNSQGLLLTATWLDMKNVTDTKAGNDTVPFQVTSVPSTDAAPTAFEASTTTYTYNRASEGAETRHLYIKYTAPALLDPGTYEATINLTVTDNT